MSEIIRKRFAVYAVIQHTHVRISKTFVNLMKPEKYGKCSAVMLHTQKKIGICKYGRKTVIKFDLTFLHVLFTLPIVHQYAQTRDF